MEIHDLPSSYKDPSGFVFLYRNRILRQINNSYKRHYESLMQTGLYKELVDKKLLIPHTETSVPPAKDGAYKVIEPERIPFISYPYEWCFSQLKDAALATLQIQKISLGFGMTLKDASSFNIQYMYGRPVLIDTLSFEQYEEGMPWIAYKQFCEQFLAPLTLMSYTDIRLNKLLQTYLEGIPLDLATKLLPFSARLKLPLFLHMFLHTRWHKKTLKASSAQEKKRHFSRRPFMSLIEHLEDGIRSLSCKRGKTVWSEYYNDTDSLNYSEGAWKEKVAIVGRCIDILHPKMLWDLGSNTGIFSRISAKKGAFTVSIDNDPLVVEQNYLQVKKDHEKNVLPLCVDIANPTPSVGWENTERESLLRRPLPDTILALALVHHLAIGNNLPFSKLSALFARLCHSLIIEFIPKEDRMVRLLLQNRADIFDQYDETHFEKEFRQYFVIKQKSTISGSQRILYLMNNKKNA